MDTESSPNLSPLSVHPSQPQEGPRHMRPALSDHDIGLLRDALDIYADEQTASAERANLIYDVDAAMDRRREALRLRRRLSTRRTRR